MISNLVKTVFILFLIKSNEQIEVLDINQNTKQQYDNLPLPLSSTNVRTTDQHNHICMHIFFS